MRPFETVIPFETVRPFETTNNIYPSHWVVMQAAIGCVDLYIMTYAWSSKGVEYMVSSCWKTVMHTDPLTWCFEDEYGNVQEKELPCPPVAHMLYEFLPLIDEHNTARQNALLSRSTG